MGPISLSTPPFAHFKVSVKRKAFFQTPPTLSSFSFFTLSLSHSLYFQLYLSLAFSTGLEKYFPRQTIYKVFDAERTRFLVEAKTCNGYDLPRATF